MEVAKAKLVLPSEALPMEPGAQMVNEGEREAGRFNVSNEP